MPATNLQHLPDMHESCGKTHRHTVILSDSDDRAIGQVLPRQLTGMIPGIFTGRHTGGRYAGGSIAGAPRYGTLRLNEIPIERLGAFRIARVEGSDLGPPLPALLRITG